MRKGLLIFFLLGLLACNDQSNSYAGKEDNNGDEVYSVSSENREMNTAMAKAASTYDDFILKLRSGDSSLSMFSVKMRFAYGEEGEAEHMWITDLYLKGDTLFGMLSNDPMYITRVTAGDIVEVSRDSVSDWMYVRDNKLVGGYTIKVMYDMMSSEEQKDFRDQIDFQID